MFVSDTLEFAGFGITPTNIQPNDKHIHAIRDFPTPQNIIDIILVDRPHQPSAQFTAIPHATTVQNSLASQAVMNVLLG